MDWIIRMKEEADRTEARRLAFVKQQLEAGEDLVSAGLTGAEYAAYVAGESAEDIP